LDSRYFPVVSCQNIWWERYYHCCCCCWCRPYLSVIFIKSKIQFSVIPPYNVRHHGPRGEGLYGIMITTVVSDLHSSLVHCNGERWNPKNWENKGEGGISNNPAWWKRAHMNITRNNINISLTYIVSAVIFVFILLFNFGGFTSMVVKIYHHHLLFLNLQISCEKWPIYIQDSQRRCTQQ
jgi:hypothetical protein